MSFLNQPILRYSNEIRSAVLMIHGEKAHSCYFSRDAYAAMIAGQSVSGQQGTADHPRTRCIPTCTTSMDVIPFDKMEVFIRDAMK